jgi:hypothetical protein
MPSFSSPGVFFHHPRCCVEFTQSVFIQLLFFGFSMQLIVQPSVTGSEGDIWFLPSALADRKVVVTRATPADCSAPVASHAREGSKSKRVLPSRLKKVAATARRHIGGLFVRGETDVSIAYSHFVRLPHAVTRGPER